MFYSENSLVAFSLIKVKVFRVHVLVGVTVQATMLMLIVSVTLFVPGSLFVSLF